MKVNCSYDLFNVICKKDLLNKRNDTLFGITKNSIEGTAKSKQGPHTIAHVNIRDVLSTVDIYNPTVRQKLESTIMPLNTYQDKLEANFLYGQESEFPTSDTQELALNEDNEEAIESALKKYEQLSNQYNEAKSKKNYIQELKSLSALHDMNPYSTYKYNLTEKVSSSEIAGKGEAHKEQKLLNATLRYRDAHIHIKGKPPRENILEVKCEYEKLHEGLVDNAGLENYADTQEYNKHIAVYKNLMLNHSNYNALNGLIKK